MIAGLACFGGIAPDFVLQPQPVYFKSIADLNRANSHDAMRQLLYTATPS
jgi:hypothetical protein